MYSVCNLRFFCYWFDSRNQNKNDFLKLGTDLGAKSIYGPNRESAQNIGTKSAFSPFFFLFFFKLHFTTLTYTLYYTLYPKILISIQVNDKLDVGVQNKTSVII